MKSFPLAILLIFCLFSLQSQAQDIKNDCAIHVELIDSHTRQPTPVRVKLVNARGHHTNVPDEAISIMYGRDDRPERYSYQPDSSFYVDGEFNLELPAGQYKLQLSNGMEYLEQFHEINLETCDRKTFTFEMERWINMADSGWYAADDHIHIRRSPRENPLILKWVEAEGLNVGVMLQMGDFWATYFSQYAFGEEGVFQEGESMLSTGQEEPRTHEIGHTIAMVADDFVRYRNAYYEYDKYFDEVHRLNGIMGYAHQGMSFNGFRGMTLDVLAGKVDFLELMQFCVEGGPLITQNYYHFLDLGYKLTATAGSDFPWCGIGPAYGVEGPVWNARIGNVRFYTHVDGEFGYNSWKKNLVAGHTFVTSGPVLLLTVNDRIPGDHLDLDEPGKVTISAIAYGHDRQVALSKLEVVAHGKVLRLLESDGAQQSASCLHATFEMDINEGMWIAARCYAGLNQIAHTTPVYVTIQNGGFQNTSTMKEYLAQNEIYLAELEAELMDPSDHVNQRAWWHSKRLKERIEETRMIIAELKNKYLKE